MNRTALSPTYWVKIYMAGDIQHAKQILRKLVSPPNKGLCVTVEPTTYIYSGGEESGFVVGLLNYPKFPATDNYLWERALQIAGSLREELYQDSFLIMDPVSTFWATNRPKQET